MTDKLQFYIVDVFAEQPYSGNQLAVFVDAEKLSTAQMQQLALEMNYSETTFIQSIKQDDNEFEVRIFTPKEEVPFAGHPTLGTAYVINEFLLAEPRTKIVLILKVGKIPVHRERETGIYRMNQKPPKFGKQFDREMMATLLSLNPKDIDDRFPVQTVSTGLPFIIVPLRSLEAIRKCKINHSVFPGIFEESDAKMVLLFASETYHPENDLNVRVFADYYGVPEDPATGSANGCLAAYLVKHEYFYSKTVSVKVEQGYEINRPSLLYLQAKKSDDTLEVRVGGIVQPVASAKLL